MKNADCKIYFDKCVLALAIKQILVGMTSDFLKRQKTTGDNYLQKKMQNEIFLKKNRKKEKKPVDKNFHHLEKSLSGDPAPVFVLLFLLFSPKKRKNRNSSGIYF